MGNDTVRLNLRIGKNVRARIEMLKDATGAESLTEVLRRALALYDALLQERAKGYALILRDDDGSEREVSFMSEEE